MSLLQNEDFAIYQLRTSYLTHIRDGVGERLIDINTAFLNDPAFRAAGWTADPAQLKRTYSPPIPAAITSDYFQAPVQPAGGLTSPEEEEDEGGMVTGGAGNETVGFSMAGRRRRRKEPQDEDDSSDLSDESEDEIPSASRPANKVSFAKMPGRERAGSSPIRSTRQQDSPALIVTHPSQRGGSPRPRRGSLGAVEAMKARKRRDTTTSSEVSSENEVDQAGGRRHQPTQTSRLGETLADQAEVDEEVEEIESAKLRAEDDNGTLSDDDSSLASDFSETIGSTSLLDATASSRLESESLDYMRVGRPRTPTQSSPKKNKPNELMFQDLPPARPISTIKPVSALAMAIKARNTKPVSPVERFATLSGKGDPQPLYLKIYLPGSGMEHPPLDLTLRKVTNEGTPVTVADAIGFFLWTYAEEDIKPPIIGAKLNVNWWTLRIVEDEEVDYDFPALSRTMPITDFTSNNNRPARGRGRERVKDEFALVEATPEQMQSNENETPIFSEQAAKAQADADAAASATDGEAEEPNSPPQPPPQPVRQHTNPIVNPRMMTTTFRKDSAAALDAPALPASHATPRSGVAKKLHIHITDNNMNPHTEIIDATTDTYIAEVFDQVCMRLNLDKALFYLKVSNTDTIAPSDRTVEALGQNRYSLDLVRRRFVGEGDYGMIGSPGSTSPSAPLMLNTSSAQGASKRTGRKAATGGGGATPHPLAQQADLTSVMASFGVDKRYNVLRKQPMSFTPSHPRVLALDDEYLHIMPNDIAPNNRDGGGRLQLDLGGKTTTVHFSNVVGCKMNRKHPKTFRVVVFRERETKRYDFEAANAEEAAEIVSEIKKRTEPFANLLR